MKKILFTIIILVLLYQFGSAQNTDSTIFNSDFTTVHLNLKVKLLDEFISRFNGDYNSLGKRISKMNRNSKIKFLVDYEYYQRDSLKVDSFIKSTVNNDFKLKYTVPNWYAEVECLVKYNGNTEKIVLMMQIETDENQKSKWVIKNVKLPFVIMNVNSKNSNNFINPVNNETKFSDFSKYMTKEKIQYIAYEYFQYDYLSVFMFLTQNKLLQFSQVNEIKYVFFTSYYRFEVKDFNRENLNSGWLISKVYFDTLPFPLLNEVDILNFNQISKEKAIQDIIQDVEKLKDSYQNIKN